VLTEPPGDIALDQQPISLGHAICSASLFENSIGGCAPRRREPRVTAP
jgi:hypothetical protein